MTLWSGHSPEVFLAGPGRGARSCALTVDVMPALGLTCVGRVPAEKGGTQ